MHCRQVKPLSFLRIWHKTLIWNKNQNNILSRMKPMCQSNSSFLGNKFFLNVAYTCFLFELTCILQFLFQIVITFYLSFHMFSFFSNYYHEKHFCSLWVLVHWYSRPITVFVSGKVNEYVLVRYKTSLLLKIHLIERSRKVFMTRNCVRIILY